MTRPICRRTFKLSLMFWPVFGAWVVLLVWWLIRRRFGD
jgi:hypothetical protein